MMADQQNSIADPTVAPAPASMPLAAPPDDPSAAPARATPNHFDQFDADPDAGEPGLYERARLNAADAFYRGTLRGATTLAGMARVVTSGDEITQELRQSAAMALGSNTSAPSSAMQDIPELTDGEVRKWRDDQRTQYAQIVADLARYDAIRPWGTSTQGAAALAGQIGGGLLTPENLLGGAAKGTTWLARTGRAALQQGVISGVVDPVRQYFDILGGVQNEFSAAHTGWAVGTGAIIGGGLHVGGELIPSARIKDIHTDLAAEDPQFASAATAAPATMAEPGAEAPQNNTPLTSDNSDLSKGSDTRAREAPERADDSVNAPVSATSNGPTTARRPSNLPTEVPEEMFRGYGRDTKEAGYNGTAVPILGEGKYFAFDENSAKEFGPQVERDTVNNIGSNPLVITDGEQWRKLTKEAGWETPNPHGRTAEQVAEQTQRLRELVEAQGHDGVVVWWNDKIPYDVGPNGENLKLLRNVFGTPQAISYKPSPLVPPKDAIGDAVPAMPVHRVAVADGSAIEVAPRVIEASDLKASSDEGYDAALQPRERDRAASQAQILDIAGNLDPERLGASAEADRGAPIVGADAMVESGNGRLMAIRRAYEDGGEAAQRYRRWLAEQGIDVSKFREPVLVRQRLTDLTPEQRQAFTVAANQSASLAMSAPERALADARLLPSEALDLIRNPEDLAAIANRDFVRAFVAKLPQTEQGMMVNAEGGLSAEGLTRVRNAVLARAYGNAHVLTRVAESLTDDNKNISNALVAAAPHWARLRSEIEAGLVRADIDLTPELLEAVSRTADLRAKGSKLDSYLAQQDAFDRLAEPVEAFMRMFYDPKGRRAAGSQRIADALRFYAEEGAKVSADGSLDLGMVPVTARDIQKLAVEKGAQGYAKRTDEGGLFLAGGPGRSESGQAGRGEVPGLFAQDSSTGPRAASPDGDIRTSGGPRADELNALASRRGGGSLPMQRARPSAGISADTGTGTSIATVPEAPSPQRDVAIRSLQQQAMDLAKHLDFPLREGRIQSRNALGVFKPGTGVVRVREVPDFEVVAHEAGHAIEYKVGQDLTDLTERFASELTPMVTNPAAYDPSVHVKEGFAEFVRRYIGNPAWAQQNAPRFTNAFRAFMEKRAPGMLAAIDRAGEAYRAYLDAPSVDAIGSVVRSVDEEPHGLIGRAIAAVREDGLPTVIKSVLQNAYRSILDDKAPAAQAVRELAAAIRKQTGSPLDLKAADNPEILLRLSARSQQAAIGDLMEGVRPYHAATPGGPSLSAAIEIATNGRNSGGWGKFDPVKKADFSTYLVARRAEVLWRKFKSGQLLNPPAAFSTGDAARAMADLEAANPTFRQSSQMVHDYTRQLLRKAFEGGLIPADLYQKLSREEFYVPFMRDMSDKPMASSGFTSSPEGPGMTQVVKRMTGSSRDIKDPIESIMMQTFLVNRTLQHNDVIRSFVSLSQQAGIAGGKYVEKVPAHEARQYKFDLADAVEKLAKKQGIDPDDTAFITGTLTDVFGEDPIMGSFFRMEPTGKRGEPIVFYKEGGELQAARFMSESEGLPLYELVTALPAKMTDMFSELVAASSSLVRTGIVTNPTFAISNYIRDQFATAILRSDYVPIVSGMKGVYGEFAQSEAARLYGAGGGVSPGSSISPVERAIEADVNALAKKGYLVNRVTSFKGAMELASFTEAGTRNSVFGKVFEAKKIEGLSDYEAMVEAAYQATDLLDFSRHGSRTDAVRRYVPFINAHFQGLDKAYRTMVQPLLDKARGDQVLSSDAPAFRNALMSWTKAFGVGGVLGAGWAALNAGSEAYRDASPQIKGTHVVIPFGNKLILVPKPFELSIGFTAGEYAYQRFAQADPRAASQLVDAVWNVLQPPNPLTDIPIIRTPIELTTGKSLFTGRDIVPDTIARRTPAEQYTDRTSALAKYIGRTIGVSPIKVDYAVGAAFGTWGRDAMALSQGVDEDAPSANWDDAVFFRRFIKDPTRTSDVTTKFWDLMGQSTGKYNQNVASFDNLVKTFHDADAQQFLAKLPSNEKAYVTLKSAANEDGKPAFNADQKRLQPLVRASDAVTLLNGLRRDLAGNTFNTFETGQPLKISPTTRRDLIDNIRELAQVEMRNAFVIMKEPGYAGRPIISPQLSMDKIRALSPTVADEIAARYATSKIYTTDAVAAAYPELQRSLVSQGSEADVAGLAFDAKADGYEFGGERVKKPPKRRLPVQPEAAVH